MIKDMAFWSVKTLNILMTTCLIIICMFFGYIFICNVLRMQVPTLGPYRIYIVLSDSMAPYMSSNDAVIVRETAPEKLAEGDVITFYAFESDTIITHRITSSTATDDGYAFATKGDHNNVGDSFMTPEERVIGKVVYKIPKFGLFFENVSQKPYMIAMIVAALIAIQFIFGLLENIFKPVETEAVPETANIDGLLFDIELTQNLTPVSSSGTVNEDGCGENESD